MYCYYLGLVDLHSSRIRDAENCWGHQTLDHQQPYWISKRLCCMGRRHQIMLLKYQSHDIIATETNQSSTTVQWLRNEIIMVWEWCQSSLGMSSRVRMYPQLTRVQNSPSRTQSSKWWSALFDDQSALQKGMMVGQKTSISYFSFNLAWEWVWTSIEPKNTIVILQGGLKKQFVRYLETLERLAVELLPDKPQYCCLLWRDKREGMHIRYAKTQAR